MNIKLNIGHRRVLHRDVVYRVTSIGQIHTVQPEGDAPPFHGAVVGPLSDEPGERQWTAMFALEVLDPVGSFEEALDLLLEKNKPQGVE